MNELNEKMLKFAGFITYNRSVEFTRIARYTSPDGKYLMRVPYFPNNLNACFKWLVPKLSGDYRISLEWSLGGIICAWTIEECSENIKRSCYYSSTNTCDGGSPALALCLAIEKLIDGERK